MKIIALFSKKTRLPMPKPVVTFANTPPQPKIATGTNANKISTPKSDSVYISILLTQLSYSLT